MSIKYDWLIFIGRCQPFHHGHKHVVQMGLEQARNVLMLVGSSFRSPDIRNPFSYEQRRSMIESALEPMELPRVTIRPLRDYLYNNNKWIAEVQQHVNVLTQNDPNRANLKIGIIGYEKDSTSWYLKAFPQWDFVDVGTEYIENIDATTIRNMWLSGQSENFTRGVLRDSVHNFIYNKFPKKEFERLQREYESVTKTKAAWAGSPYEPIFQTTDAVVIQSGHILLVTRKSAPGEGQLALPGGYLNARETLEDGMIRELREETKIKVPEPVLRGCIRARHRFDAPERDLRGRFITDAYLIELPAGPLAKVRGSDDAARRGTGWYPLAEYENMETRMYADHHHVSGYLLGRV